jgi:hypothetical protein
MAARIRMVISSAKQIRAAPTADDSTGRWVARRFTWS